MTSILFVCLGNICRSPMGEAIFLHKAGALGLLDRFTVDSAGLGDWHQGERADPRTIHAAGVHGIEVQSIARKIRPRDLRDFDLLLPMDRQNREALLAMDAPPRAVRLMRSFDPALRDAAERDLDVPDPYLAGPEGFEEVFQMLESACAGLIEYLDT